MPLTNLHIFLDLWDPKKETVKRDFYNQWPDCFHFKDFPPCHPEYVNDMRHVVLSTEAHEQVMAFAQKFWDARSVALKTQVIKSPGNDKAGKEAADRWLTKAMQAWKINKIIDEIVQIDHVYATLSTSDPPSVNQSGAAFKIPIILERLFGPEVFLDRTANLFVDPTSTFVQRLLANRFNSYRHVRRREKKQVEKNEIELNALMEDFHAANDDAPTTALREKIKTWIELSTTNFNLYKKYNDEENVKKYEDSRNEFLGLLKVMGYPHSSGEGKDMRELNQKLLKAVSTLSARKEIEDVALGIQTVIESVALDRENIEPFDFNQEPEFDWEEGTEKYRTMSTEQLWNRLGLLPREGSEKRPHIPYFNMYIDKTAQISPSDEPEQFAEDCPNRNPDIIPFNIQWHQLVGVNKAVDQAFRGHPLLLMDEVGFGKTLQVVATICTLVYFHHFYKRRGHFPGAFAKAKFQNKEGNIPDLGSILVIPNTLLPQYTIEFDRYLIPNAFDYPRYEGQFNTEKRKDFWSLWHSSNQPRIQRIVLASLKAVESDAALTHTLTEVNGGELRWDEASRGKESTICNQQWLCASMDEVHAGRKLNRAHIGYTCVAEKALFALGQSATPVQQSPKDLWNIGRFLRIPGFVGPAADGLYVKMSKDLAIATRQDRKNAKQNPHSQILGHAEGRRADSATGKVIVESVGMIRKKFAGFVIRRNKDSKDFNNKPITGLAPPLELTLLLRLYSDEAAFFEQLLATATESKQFVAQPRFHLTSRLALTHKSCAYGTGWPKNLTKEIWDKIRSVKLDAVVLLIQHHLAKNNAVPARIKLSTPDKPLEIEEDVTQSVINVPEDAGPDKIIIFSNFVKNLPQIGAVLQLFGIEFLQYNGEVTPKKRAETVRQFQRPDGPRVMIISQVGSVGLNLDFANIMIVLDTLWSAQEYNQLVGRIHRYPQVKPVIVYRLVAANSPDVFLNNLSMDKGMIQEAFVTSSEKLKCLIGGTDYVPQDLESDAEVEDEGEMAEMDTKKKARSKKNPTDQATKPKRSRKKKAAQNDLTRTDEAAGKPKEKKKATAQGSSTSDTTKRSKESKEKVLIQTISTQASTESQSQSAVRQSQQTETKQDCSKTTSDQFAGYQPAATAITESRISAQSKQLPRQSHSVAQQYQDFDDLFTQPDSYDIEPLQLEGAAIKKQPEATRTPQEDDGNKIDGDGSDCTHQPHSDVAQASRTIGTQLEQYEDFDDLFTQPDFKPAIDKKRKRPEALQEEDESKDYGNGSDSSASFVATMQAQSKRVRTHGDGSSSGKQSERLKNLAKELPGTTSALPPIKSTYGKQKPRRA
ncbi:hypothetical protein VKT23_016856 [Stygiomarasmius scandens]|uniref:Helicase C-terminal domain-containing protein n=1 Tax=Marasmiellus scandens TaxID=2682957 RepID=A0ABR1ITK9_9AGAR